MTYNNSSHWHILMWLPGLWRSVLIVFDCRCRLCLAKFPCLREQCFIQGCQRLRYLRWIRDGDGPHHHRLSCISTLPTIWKLDRLHVSVTRRNPPFSEISHFHFQPCTVVKISCTFLCKRLAAQQKFPRFGFRTRIIALWPMGQSTILPVQWPAGMLADLATARDCGSGFIHEVVAAP